VDRFFFLTTTGSFSRQGDASTNPSQFLPVGTAGVPKKQPRPSGAKGSHCEVVDTLIKRKTLPYLPFIKKHALHKSGFSDLHSVDCFGNYFFG
jgi:hypothetical protein